MKRLLSAELAELFEFKLALNRLLVLVGIVVAILALAAFQTSQLLFYLAFRHKGQYYPRTYFVVKNAYHGSACPSSSPFPASAVTVFSMLSGMNPKSFRDSSTFML